jgi:hypothetical protein
MPLKIPTGTGSHCAPSGNFGKDYQLLKTPVGNCEQLMVPTEPPKIATGSRRSVLTETYSKLGQFCPLLYATQTEFAEQSVSPCGAKPWVLHAWYEISFERAFATQGHTRS